MEHANLGIKQRGPGRPPRLMDVYETHVSPLYFITICTANRKRILAQEQVHSAFRLFAQRGWEEKRIATGRYVLMPDHLHLFVSGSESFILENWVRLLKQVLGKTLSEQQHSSPFWQRGFFDHLIRNSESYSQKWEYVRENPARAGLVADYKDWPHQGEIIQINRD
jgi:putative transposase